ncbi:HK97 gp10 family phage protein [Streptococcus dysgalactiae]|uniref:HK97 gp10 family phage protein n=1 Tax=Streptococcus dysgalactiae TaxID=1334 RepID=A0AAE9UNR5_STRDY|nr:MULTISPECIES: HK97 gp10 family phage protein [Streptococcus]QGH04846.1 hypothetical protein EA458_10560 [Streptococcus dysgalactiae subsp. dysgalactiae]QKG77438.1 HK97 gp10 family phage protein [Streptococcus canis]WAI93945.1 HK97 gp10 family phage protein [Streptococcus dysgalactiae]WCE86575.1 HK97 gp10 family phage protein [Streptococcus dysgalactiae]WCN26570.1 HK97 gp10 family phage protein [Streptococcus dysgalactiae]
MSGFANLKGIDEVLSNMEKKLGPAKVNRVVNKALKESGQELEPGLKSAVSVYINTGATVDSAVVSGVQREDGIPKVKLGFVAPRWNIVHLQELDYGWKHNKRGVGHIRRFADKLEGEYPTKIREKLRGGFDG